MPVAIPDFTDADRHGTGAGRRTPTRELRWATPLLRVNVSLVPAVARTAAAGTGIAR